MFFLNGRYPFFNEKTTTGKLLSQTPMLAASTTAAFICTASLKQNHNENYDFAIRYTFNFFATLLYTITYILSRESIRNNNKNECATCIESEFPIKELATVTLDALINVGAFAFVAGLAGDAIAYLVMRTVDIIVASLLIGSAGGFLVEVCLCSLLFIFFNRLFSTNCHGKNETIEVKETVKQESGEVTVKIVDEETPIIQPTSFYGINSL